MMTGVQYPHPSGSETAPPNGTPRSAVSAPQLTDAMTEIHHLRRSIDDSYTTEDITNPSTAVARVA